MTSTTLKSQSYLASSTILDCDSDIKKRWWTKFGITTQLTANLGGRVQRVTRKMFLIKCGLASSRGLVSEPETFAENISELCAFF